LFVLYGHIFIIRVYIYTQYAYIYICIYICIYIYISLDWYTLHILKHMASWLPQGDPLQQVLPCGCGNDDTGDALDHSCSQLMGEKIMGKPMGKSWEIPGKIIGIWRDIPSNV
jgi:hypothetical protein